MRGSEVVIVEAVRTPVGRGHPEKGYYRDIHPNDLLGRTWTAVIERTGIPAEAVEDVITGCVQQYGEQSYNVGRNAWLQAGLPIETPATTIDRQCGSAQQAVNFAAALVASGVHDVAIGGGVEHMGHIPLSSNWKIAEDLGTPFPSELLERHPLVNQGVSAELIAETWGISRTECDEIALRSHQRAARATDEGRFEREILPFSVNGSTYTTDQGIRRETTLDALSELKPAFKDDGLITAGNSSQISDGASAGDVAREGRRARRKAARAHRRPVDRRRRSRHDADRADSGDEEDSGQKRNDDRRPRPDRDQRGIRLGDRGLGA